MFWKGFASAFALIAAVSAFIAFLEAGDRRPLSPSPPDLVSPPLHASRGGEGAGQAQPGDPPPPPPPLPPFDRDPNAGPDQTGPRDNESAWDLSGFAARAWSRFWDALPADKTQTLFNSLLVLIGFLQWRVYRTQANIMRETREISFAALGRPHIFFQFVLHTFEDWREGKMPLRFGFRFVNYGTSPAIVRYVAVRAFLSRGPGTQEDANYISIKGFPKRARFCEIHRPEQPPLRMGNRVRRHQS